MFTFSSGTTDVSVIDPVTVGRNVFGVVNDFANEIGAYIQDIFCTILDFILDIFKGTSTFFSSSVFCIHG